MTTSPTVTLQFTQAILQAAGRHRIELPGELRAAVPSSGRVPLALQDQLWEAFCASAGDPMIGLRLGLDLQVGHLDLVGMLLMSCQTQGEALDLLLEYHPIVGEGGDFEVRHEDEDCLLVYQPHFRVRRRERVEAVMACVLNMTRWITGDRFQARAIHLTGPAGDDRQAYEDLLGAPVRFGAPANALVFPPSLQATPLVQANAEMRQQLQRLADQSLAALESNSLARRVQELIRRSPALGREGIAEQLGISGRHLVRRLQEDGTTFKLLRSTVLQQMAEHRLMEGASVSALAEELGFSDESAFNKAFKRWAGMTPARFREKNAEARP